MSRCLYLYEINERMTIDTKNRERLESAVQIKLHIRIVRWMWVNLIVS